jgi:predicted transcriptional regulator
MSFNYSQDITIVSLIVSLVALIISLIVLSIVRGKKNEPKEHGFIDAVALVQEFSERQKRLEQRMVDEKVRLEILELRLSRQARSQTSAVGDLEERRISIPRREPGSKTINENVNINALDQIARSDRQMSKVSYVSSGPRKDKIVTEILEAVLEDQGNITARQIQERISRSREHTARMMNLLYKQGLVSRDVNMRPFTYSVTEAGRRELGS